MAADYLRSVLSVAQYPKSRLSLEENLLNLFPGSPLLLQSLAEADFLTGNIRRGEVALSQAEVIDQSCAPQCEILRKKFNLPPAPVEKHPDAQYNNALGIRQVVVVDPDTDVLHHIQDLLSHVGVQSIEIFETAPAAIQFLTKLKTPPDLILCEWRMLGMNGAVFVQRVRRLGMLQVPIVVLSSQVKTGDLPLLREMGVDELMVKPFGRGAFFKTVVVALQQHRFPTEQKSLKNKIQRMLTAKKIDEAAPLIASLFANYRLQDATKKEVEAEYLFAHDDFASARDRGIEALNAGGDALALLNVIGKSMLNLREYTGALSCFEKADALSSGNVERLLLMAELHLAINDDTQAAESAVARARQIDPTNDGVTEGVAKIAFARGEMERCAELLQQLESGIRIVGFLNNRAIALVRSGKFQDALVSYRKALAVVPEKWTEARGILLYNVALAFARYGDLNEALGLLGQIRGNVSFPMRAKIKSLGEKLRNSIGGGKSLVLNSLGEQSVVSENQNTDSSQGTGPNSAQLLADIVQHDDIKRGQICCYLVFKAVEEIDRKVLALLDHMPRFVRTSAIDRAETFKKLKAQ